MAKIEEIKSAIVDREDEILQKFGQSFPEEISAKEVNQNKNYFSVMA